MTPNTEKVFRVSSDGSISVRAHGFTTELGIDFDGKGRMYVLETSRAPGFPTPSTGRVVRLNSDGTRTVIVDKLFFPTAMHFGPDGKLYISNKGFGPPQPGEILRVAVPNDSDRVDHQSNPLPRDEGRVCGPRFRVTSSHLIVWTTVSSRTSAARTDRS